MYKFRAMLLIIAALNACTGTNDQVAGSDEAEVTLGILGGMGPEATADLYLQVLNYTPATTDQGHIPTLIYSNVKIPDRVSAINSGDTSILGYLRNSVRKLEEAGASYIAIPCNTAHYFYDVMQNAVSIPIINMISETATVAREEYPGVTKIGLLATSGTIMTGLYEKELKAKGFEVISPDPVIQEEYVMKAVRGVKAATSRQENEDLLAVAGQHLADRGAELIVLGCTEIPLAYNPGRVDLPMVNATEVLARKAVEIYYEMLK